MVVPFGPGTTTDTVARVVADGARQGAAPDGGRRQPRRRRRRDRHRPGRQGRGRRQDAGDGHGRHARDQRLAVPASCPTTRCATSRRSPSSATRRRCWSSPPARRSKSLKDLAALAARPEGVTFASAGNGTSGHLAGELLAQRLGGKMIHVPYKEGAVALTSVMSGQVDFMFYHPAAVMPQIKAGKLRALGASGAVRSAAAPDVPTLMEQGVKDFDLVAWFMLYAPAATPPAALAHAARAPSAAALAQPDADGPAARAGRRAARDARRRDGAVQPDRARQVGRAGEALRRAGRLSTRRTDETITTSHRRRP